MEMVGTVAVTRVEMMKRKRKKRKKKKKSPKILSRGLKRVSTWSTMYIIRVCHPPKDCCCIGTLKQQSVNS